MFLTMKPAYYLNEHGEFVIENYNEAKPFSSFLPAVAGVYGRPLWVYYVNRGQCIATMGVNNKDYAIMEFLPADKAYRYTSLQGFRTFLKIKAGGKNPVCYEPFQHGSHYPGHEIKQTMYITSYDLRLVEWNHTLGIKTEVMFSPLPGEAFAALLRKVSVANMGAGGLEVEILDGLPVIIPYYLTDVDLKTVSNLRQAWMRVENHEYIPFYRIKVLPYDTPETFFVQGGNFYLSFTFNRGRPDLVKTIVEPAVVFGNVTDFTRPRGFWDREFTFPEKQVVVGNTPCGFGWQKIRLERGESSTLYNLIGSCSRYETIDGFVQKKLSEQYIEEKIEENRDLIEGLKSRALTAGASREFNLYCGQTFLDNFLRGGYPLQLGKKHVFYVYSRKHGDLEREYNFFQVDASYFSQGNGNYRDVNQNRRNDIWFFPFTGAANIKLFFNLLQLDGYNPLVLKGTQFVVEDWEQAGAVLDEYIGGEEKNIVRDFLERPFTPGGLLEYMENREIKLKKENTGGFLEALLNACGKEDPAEHSEGYWVDHWTYNTDLLEQFAAVFPDKVKELLFEEAEYTYYDSAEVVVPRDKKYVLTPSGVRQQGAVVRSPEKERLLKARKTEVNKVRMEYGKGAVYKCTLLSKILCLLVNKVALLDPAGTGVEMEADKPGWCDALNGLPALFGSSINESVEIKRLALFLLEVFSVYKVSDDVTVKVPEEVYGFFMEIYKLLTLGVDGYEYWQQSHRAGEEFRAKTLLGISGREEEIDLKTVKTFLRLVVEKVRRGLEKAFNKDQGLYYTYFINEVTGYEILKDQEGKEITNPQGYPYVRPTAFKQRPLPYFLEGPVHVLRVEKDKEKARKLYQAVKKSGLYDKKLGMYKVNDDLTGETSEIGRQNIFPRGWLENESVFLHMEYKYLLEVLRSGLYEEFFTDLPRTLVPFLDPAVYGRSILENSSFIATSAHPDEKIHGRGFVSRLTGASAEFLSMWRYLTAGAKPFFLNEQGELCLEFKPVLPADFFTTRQTEVEDYRDGKRRLLSLPAGTFTFNFLGQVLVVYYNPNRKDTFGEEAAESKKILLFQEGALRQEITGGFIPPPYAREIREGKIGRIEIYLE